MGDRDLSRAVCFLCKEKGHLKKDCPKQSDKKPRSTGGTPKTRRVAFEEGPSPHATPESGKVLCFVRPSKEDEYKCVPHCADTGSTHNVVSESMLQTWTKGFAESSDSGKVAEKTSVTWVSDENSVTVKKEIMFDLELITVDGRKVQALQQKALVVDDPAWSREFLIGKPTLEKLGLLNDFLK